MSETNSQASFRSDPVRYVVSVQQQCRLHNWLSLWTIYDHPNDFPNDYIARCFVTGEGFSGPHALTNYILAPSLKELRSTMRAAGLVCLTRNESDDAKIIETWL